MLSAATIQDFVNAQGTDGFPLFVPPVKNYLGASDPARGRGISVDYAGLANQYLKTQGIDLGTTTSGSVAEQRRSDGSGSVHVVLQTRNAMTFAFDLASGDFAMAPLSFGARATDVVSGATPALASSTLTLDFTEAHVGDPMPDLLHLLFTTDRVKSLTLQGSATGTLADGTPARATVTQAALLTNPALPGDGGFPVENILLQPLRSAPASTTAGSSLSTVMPISGDVVDVQPAPPLLE